MPINRHFLGWDAPVLPVAAAWLRQRFGLDMQKVVVAVPAARAGRRLLELLAEAATQAAEALAPPRIVTAGQLPELLFVSEDEPAEALPATLARAAALRDADRDVLQRVVPHPPEDGDAVGWFRLAEQLGDLSDQLAAARLTPAKVVELAAIQGFDLALSEPRWEALARLDDAYRQALGRDDRQSARQRAIETKNCRCEHPVVLLGLVDLTAQLAGLLNQLDDITALIPAPESHAAGFDPLGGLVVEYWQDQPVKIADLKFVDQPRDQAIELVRVLGGLPDGTAADDVTVGLGDEDAAGTLGRAIELAGTPARAAAGRALLKASPVVLLDTLGRYADRQQFADLAALVRHPDLHDLLGDEPWASRLDIYASMFLQTDTHGEWRGEDETRQQLDALRQRIGQLLPENLGPTARQPLPAWSEPIADVLRRTYGHHMMDRHRDHDAIEALQQIANALREQAALDPASSASPRVTFAQAVSLTVGRLSGGRVPPRGGEPAVELLGFLELPWDDASHVVLTDMNEGFVPDARNADAFLPDGLRRVLGLPDNARRYARDVLLMNIVLRSRAGGGGGGGGSVAVRACRTSAEGDPRVPSRLLLACDEEARIARVNDFYAEHTGPPATAPLLLTPGKASRFLIPRPLMDAPVLDKLSATQFRDYIACPYRFYLKHVARLDTLDDRATEMDALAFGSLAHGILEEFGKSELADAADASAIEAFLNERLDAWAGGRFGRRPRPAVRVQVEQLRERLARFADVQAREARQGWRIRGDLIEKRREARIEVDGEPFTITGTIDRIDEHPQHGFRVLDYKTSDTASPPEKTHQKQGRWIDLQLPLYRALVAPLGIEVGPSGMGYVNLSKSAEGRAVGVVMAKWGEGDLAEAMAERDRVIRGVRDRIFWPPSVDPPRYEDAFTRLASDRALNRPELIGGDA